MFKNDDKWKNEETFKNEDRIINKQIRVNLLHTHEKKIRNQMFPEIFFRPHVQENDKCFDFSIIITKCEENRKS